MLLCCYYDALAVRWVGGLVMWVVSNCSVHFLNSHNLFTISGNLE